MKIDVADIYKNATPNGSFIKMKVDEAPIGVYYSVDPDNLPSIAFLSKNPPIEMDSTRCIKSSQWQERMMVYWSKLSLLYEPARMAFYSLCGDLLKAVQEVGTENEAIVVLANRYRIWKKMFQGNGKEMSEEEYKGLFGELIFLLKYMIPKYGIENAISSWSGANRTAKDFSINEDWFEVKTTSINSSEVNISSLAQLSSEVDGHLCVVKTEKMANEYDDGLCMVSEAVTQILNAITDISIKDSFIDKLLAYGYSLETDKDENGHYRVVSVDRYLVNKDFPKITKDNVPYEEIVKTSYSISLPAILSFKEE